MDIVDQYIEAQERYEALCEKFKETACYRRVKTECGFSMAFDQKHFEKLQKKMRDEKKRKKKESGIPREDLERLCAKWESITEDSGHKQCAKDLRKLIKK